MEAEGQNLSKKVFKIGDVVIVEGDKGKIIDIYKPLGTYRVTLTKGNMKFEDADAIACAVDNNLNLAASGSAARSLLSAGGKSLHNECRERFPSGIKYGEVIVLDGGNLNCKKVFLTSLDVCEVEDEEHNFKKNEVLKNTLSAILDTAIRENVKSIAIPAIGIGKMGLSAETVASIYFDCVEQKMPTFISLRNIRFILYYNSVFKEFESKLHVFRMKGVTLTNGNIQFDDAEAIACAVDNRLNLGASGSAAISLLSGGGKSLQNECRERFPAGIKYGEVIVLDGGNLKCKKVFLTSLEDCEVEDEEHDFRKYAVLQNTLSAILDTAKREKVKSIAIPAIGVGKMGISAKTVASIYFDCVKKRTSAFGPFRNIRFILYCNSVFKEFERQLYRRQGYISAASSTYHHKLKMGCSISNNKAECIVGTLGPFVDISGGRTGFLTCAHTLFDIDSGALNFDDGLMTNQLYVVQPPKGSFGSLPFQSLNDTPVGHVHKAIFDPHLPTGIDAAVIEITDESRIPEHGQFAIDSKNSLIAAGFDDQPVYNSGIFREPENVSPLNVVIKAGSKTHITRGRPVADGIHLRRLDVILAHSSMQETYIMKNQIEIASFKDSQAFFLPGDSGSAVFYVNDDRSLECIGLAIGCTSDNTAVVTPIRSILERFPGVTLKQF